MLPLPLELEAPPVVDVEVELEVLVEASPPEVEELAVVGPEPVVEPAAALLLAPGLLVEEVAAPLPGTGMLPVVPVAEAAAPVLDAVGFEPR